MHTGSAVYNNVILSGPNDPDTTDGSSSFRSLEGTGPCVPRIGEWAELWDCILIAFQFSIHFILQCKPYIIYLCIKLYYSNTI